MPLVILADDLTGAADCAARCHHAGLPATIALHAPSGALPPGACALSSDSRWLEPKAAAKRVYALITELPGAAGARWYKKIDSTLRGNIGAEIDAMLDALGRAIAVICPAFPAQGRGLRGGRLVAPPPAEPIDFPAMLTSQSLRRVAAVGLAHVRAGVPALAGRLAEDSQAAQLLVVDALAENDLDEILEAAELALPGALLCGSAGLVGALARRLAPGGALTEVHAMLGGPALIVVGSGSAMAQRQIAYLRKHEPIAAIELGDTTPDRFSVDPTGARSRLSARRDTLLHLPPPPTHAALDGPLAHELAARLAEAALEAIEQLRPGLLLVAGGDTAGSILDRLGAEHLGVVREVAPGMPLARGTTAGGDELHILLKAGNHGDEATLVELLRAVKRKP